MQVKWVVRKGKTVLRKDNGVEEQKQIVKKWASLLTIAKHPHPPRFLLHPLGVFQTNPKKNFNVNIKLKKAVHGYLSPRREERASLLVFDVQLVSLRKKGHFKRINIVAKFLEPQGSSEKRPQILAHAPFESPEALNLSENEVGKTTVTTTSGGINVNLIRGKVSARREEKKEIVSVSIEKYFGQGSSGVSVDEDGNRSTIWWNVKQSSSPNAKDDAGIDPHYRFAVLLTRDKKDNAVFRVKITLLVEAGLPYLIENNLSHVTPVKDLDINPRIRYVGDKSIDRKRLGQFRDKEKLTALTKTGR